MRPVSPFFIHGWDGARVEISNKKDCNEILGKITRHKYIDSTPIRYCSIFVAKQSCCCYCYCDLLGTSHAVGLRDICVQCARAPSSSTGIFPQITPEPRSGAKSHRRLLPHASKLLSFCSHFLDDPYTIGTIGRYCAGAE